MWPPRSARNALSMNRMEVRPTICCATPATRKVPGTWPAGRLRPCRWSSIPANITKVTGTHTVYLEFSSGASGDPPYVSLHYFSFPVS